MKSIVAAVDFSELTHSVLEQAGRLARLFGAELRVIHAAPPDPDFVGYEAGPQSERDQIAALLRDEHRQLQQHTDALRDTGCDARALLLQGPTVETILAEAERAKADLIIIGSHGRGAVYRAVLGSVSEGVVRKARCPVLVVPIGSLEPAASDR